MLKNVRLVTQETEEAPRMQFILRPSGLLTDRAPVAVGGDNIRHPGFDCGLRNLLGFATKADDPRIDMTFSWWYFSTGRRRPNGMYMVCTDEDGYVLTWTAKVVSWEVLR